MERKDIKINTNAFDLTIHWNGKVVSTHLSILIGVCLTLLFAKQSSVVNLCRLVLLIDIIAILFSIFYGAYGSTEEIENNKPSTPPKKEKLDIDVNVEKNSEKQEKQSTKRNREEVIRNKVPIPDKPKPEKPEPKVMKAEELSDEMWDELFRM